MANGQQENGTMPNGSSSNSAGSAPTQNQLQPLQDQQQVKFSFHCAILTDSDEKF